MTDSVVPGGQRCGICSGPPARLAFVDERCREGYSSHAVEKLSKLPAMGPEYAVKKETVQRHRVNCLGQQPYVPAHKRAPVDGQIQHTPEAAFHSHRDFAEMVQREAVRRLMDGEIDVTVTEGLKAQALLDRREERKADRESALDIAKMLSGAGFAPPGTMIDSGHRTIIDVTPNEDPHPEPDSVPMLPNRHRRRDEGVAKSRELVAEPR